MTSRNDIPFFKCPRYSKCFVNNCPLHPAYPDLLIDEGYREQKCTMEKQVRIRIASEFPGVLKFGGLTPREFAAQKKWDELPPEEKERRQEIALFNLVSAQSRKGKGNTSPIDTYNSQAEQKATCI